MGIFRKIRANLESWFFAKAVVHLFRYAESREIGMRLDAALDKALGEAKSESVQKACADWLRKVADELTQDQA